MLSLVSALTVLLTAFPALVNGQVQPPENITISPLPTFSTCQLALISWTGGKAPYRTYIYPAGWTNQSDWIVELPLTTRQQTSWNVNLAAGSGIVVNVWDGINDEYSDPAWIQDSGDSSCLGFNGTMQSSIGSSSTQSLPTFASISSTRPSVVSTPTATPTPPPSQVSEGNGPTSSSASQAPATVTVVQPNAAGRLQSTNQPMLLALFSLAIGLFALL